MLRFYSYLLFSFFATAKATDAPPLVFDFSYTIDACDPLTVRVTALGPVTSNPYWDFGDGTIVTNQLTVTHTYATAGNYLVRHSVTTPTETDTLNKNISVFFTRENVITTIDTTICYGSTKKLLTANALSYCWTPSTFLDNPNSATPTTSATQDITYFLNTQIADGPNLVLNGNFEGGNTGFTTEYINAAINNTEGQYFVGKSPKAWNINLDNCGDHTTGTGNQLLVNGAPVADQIVWSQTIPVVPNTNYAFSVWIENLATLNPAFVQFAINDIQLGGPITATTTACQWNQFFTTWNSGNTTTAKISIINKNLIREGNDFGIDDISFSQVFIKRDSVKITVEKPPVKTLDDVTVCANTPVQLTATGAQTYSWAPAQDLDHIDISNPIATTSITRQYIVTGTSATNCKANDTVNVNVYPIANIAITPTQLICKNTSVQLMASGGNIYSWTPAQTLDDPGINNPLATPVANTKYYVAITDVNNCNYKDSVQVFIRPDPLFTANGGGAFCYGDTIRLKASGGNIYDWQPATGLDNPAIATPLAAPAITTTYSVTITETTCNQSTVLPVTVNVLPLPDITATRSVDLDCSNDQSQLNATGGIKYSWTPAITLDNPSRANPIARPQATTSYVVKGSDGNNCSNYDTVVVNVANINEGGYLMPNAFTPNNDGHNDCFGIRYWGVITKIEFSVYNRWGERIFFTRDPRGCWDGKIHGIPQATDVYVYVIKASTICDPLVFRKGTFTLIR